ncbi:MAG TPA: hypothetical protein VNU19_00745 [Candidatus Acidoferrum sp.]|jgi:hypothetical protein|nr:hypothetical protein [Candidatus Acidoferrum sp.]
MPRTKKSAQTPPNQDPPSTDEGDAATMAHIPSGELAGSPDIFAAKRQTSSDLEATTPTGPSPEPEVPIEAPPSMPEPPPMTSEPMVAPLQPPVSSAGPPPPPMATAPVPHYAPPPAPARRNGTGIALGVVLVVVGLFYLVVQVASVDLSSFGWPLLVIIPGVTLLIVGMLSLGTGAAIPGGILTMVGLVLAYQNSTGHWTSWAYAWALVAPGGVGVGLFLQGLRERNTNMIKQGRSLMFIAALIFMVGFVFFESILNISGINDQPWVKAGLPALFIVIGILLLARSISNSRRRA